MKTLVAAALVLLAPLLCSGCGDGARYRRLRDSIETPAKCGDAATVTANIAALKPSERPYALNLALSGAIEGDHPAVLTALLDAGASLDHAVAVGARHGNVDMIRTLLTRGGSLEGRGASEELTPLMEAAQAGKLAAARLLVELGASKTAEHSGLNAYMYAVRAGQDELARYLAPASAAR